MAEKDRVDEHYEGEGEPEDQEQEEGPEEEHYIYVGEAQPRTNTQYRNSIILADVGGVEANARRNTHADLHKKGERDTEDDEEYEERDDDEGEEREAVENEEDDEETWEDQDDELSYMRRHHEDKERAQDSKEGADTTADENIEVDIHYLYGRVIVLLGLSGRSTVGHGSDVYQT
ncbi:hypothetical protein LTR85_001542 [Meristemomyces frigidus]|nr:hypothetical protein LTR85_001542 [Meristemomyces frigidus]